MADAKQGNKTAQSTGDVLGWVSDTEGGEATRKVMTGGGQPVVHP